MQPLRAPTVTAGGESTGDSADPGGRGGGGGGGEGSHGSVGAAGGGGVHHATLAGAEAAQGVLGGEHDAAPARENGGGIGAGGGRAEGVDRGGMTDVVAHEIVVGCLVRLALVVEGETAVEVLSVLAHERGRARVRDGIGQGAVGPMEQVVAKVWRLARFF